MHLVVDGFLGNRERLQDLPFIYDLLDRYPATIGMTKIMPPYVFRYVGAKPEDWGISGFVLIAESHISIHTFPDHGYINIDVFSCKSFDAARAIEDMTREFGLERVASRVMERGLEYPHNLDAARETVTSERLQVVGF